MDCGPPGSSIHGIFQARILEWGAIATFLMKPYLEKSRFGPQALVSDPWDTTYKLPLEVLSCGVLLW